MIDLTLGQIAEITGGSLTGGADPHAVISGSVEFDSRNIVPGGLFVALPGQRVDGHRFAATAMEQGAVAVLAARPVDAPSIMLSSRSDSDEDVFEAVVTAMSALARVVARSLIDASTLTIVGITGSAGKTSTKDLASAVFSQAGPTIAPPGSFNNEIGHPYTVLRCEQSTDYLVAEMSARGIGHIAHLASIAPPKIGIVLNVGTAHLGEFGSRENIALAKGELVEALPAATDGGIAVLNADDPFVLAMAPRTRAKVVTYSAVQTSASATKRADYWASHITLDDVARASFRLHGPGFEAVKVSLQVFGAHQVSNALAVAAAGIEAGMDPEVVAAALSQQRAASAHRMAVSTRGDGLTIIDDSYNANPESMRAAIAALAYTASARHGARSIAVLGEMGELGEDGQLAHHLLGEELEKFNISHLITVGRNELNHATASRAREGGVEVAEVENIDEAVSLVENIVASTPAGFDPKDVVGADVVLVKASNAARLWRVAEGLYS